MGADAEIFVFDYAHYAGEVAPALTGLLRTGEPVPWLAEVFRDVRPYDMDNDWQPLADRLAGLRADPFPACPLLGDDLRYPGRGPRTPALARCTCVLHRDVGSVESFNALHQTLVVMRCLGRERFLGRNFTVESYRPALDRQDVPADDRTRELLSALGTRGAVVGYQFGAHAEGIHGWLTVPETAELADRLGALSLPRHEATFEAMVEANAALRYTDRSWEDLSLSFVRTVAVIAAAQNRAVLWGNDVYSGVDGADGID